MYYVFNTKTMLFKSVLCCCIFVTCYAQSEGDECTFNNQPGICIIYSKCVTAIRLIKLKKTPKICSFIGLDPIVCCTDQEISPGPSTFRPSGGATTIGPLRPITPLDEPPEEDYIEVNEIPTGCAPVPPELTSPRTGQTAFDKCLEYQERFVYPCEKGVTLTGDMHRANHCHHDVDELFDGYREVNRNEFPHSARLGYVSNDTKELLWLCAGTLISENFILTTAHCQKSPRHDLRFVVVGVTGIQDTNKTENIYNMKRFIPHPKYKDTSRYYDIGLLETDTPIRLSQFLVPACLDLGGAVNDSSVLALTSGYSAKTQSYSNTMLKVILQKISAQECFAMYPTARRMVNGFDALTQTCYAPRTAGQDTCQGDGGSAILIKSKAVRCMYIATGVTSIGRGCGNVMQPALYTRVVTYMPWIESIVWPST